MPRLLVRPVVLADRTGERVAAHPEGSRFTDGGRTTPTSADARRLSARCGPDRVIRGKNPCVQDTRTDLDQFPLVAVCTALLILAVVVGASWFAVQL
jgi:hypothetical protein